MLCHRGQQQTERHEQPRKRPREHGFQPLASQLSMHTKSSNHKRQLSNPKNLWERRQAQTKINLVPESGSGLLADAKSSGRVSSRAPAGGGPHEHEIALPTGSNAHSGRAPMPAKQHPAQPAFIRIGDNKDKDEPRTLHRQGHPSPALSCPGSKSPGLSTAAQTDAVTDMPFQSRMSLQHPVAISPAAAASPAAVLTIQAAPSDFSHNISAAPAAQAADLAGDDMDTPLHSSDAQQHTRAEQLSIPPALEAPTAVALTDVSAESETAAPATTAASSAWLRATKPTAAAQHLQGVTSRAAQSAVTGFAASQTPVVPETAVISPAPAPRVMLPTSRRKRNGPRAAKPQAPSKAEHSWQALLEPDACGKPEDPASTLPAGTCFGNTKPAHNAFCDVLKI